MITIILFVLADHKLFCVSPIVELLFLLFCYNSIILIASCARGTQLIENSELTFMKELFKRLTLVWLDSAVHGSAIHINNKDIVFYPCFAQVSKHYLLRMAVILSITQHFS